MRSARILIHGRLASFSVTQTGKEGLFGFCGTLGDDRGQSLNMSTLARVFFDLEGGGILLVAEEVEYLFVIDFKVGAAH